MDQKQQDREQQPQPNKDAKSAEPVQLDKEQPDEPAEQKQGAEKR